MSLSLPRGVLAATAALAAAVSLASLPARAQAPTASGDLRLLVWINGDKGFNGLQKVGDAYTRDTGVPVRVEHPVDAPDKFQAAAAGNRGPDIFCWPHDRLGEFAKSGLIVPVRPRKALRDRIEQTAWDAFTYQGKTWGYPIAIEANGLIYNKAMVKTPPATIAEVIALDMELRKQGKHAILWDYNKSFFSWSIFAGAGGEIYPRTPDGGYDTSRVGVNNAGAVRGGDAFEELFKTGVMPRGVGYAEMEAAFNRGDTAMMISGPWAWENVKKSHIDFGVAPVPAAVPGMPSKVFVGVLGCMVTAPSPAKDVARDFLENYLLSLDGLRTVNNDVPLGTPADKAFFQELSSDPHIVATMANARNGILVPNIPEIGKFWTAMDAAMEAISQQRQTPKEALDGAAARILVK
jgi:maltose/maltodextrin transport system substrate-binding protein